MLRLLRIPYYAVKWYQDRLGRMRAGDVPGWALAEVICMSLSLAAAAMLIATWILRSAGIPLPDWTTTYLLPPFVAGAVGYLTNLVAVTMLFRPYDGRDPHPIGALPFWRIGLVPRNKRELAGMAGKHVSQRLLTPEVLTEEVRTLVEAAFADERLQENLRRAAGPLLREKLPVIVESATPEVMRFLRGTVSTGLSREQLDRLFSDVLEPWLSSERNTEQLVDGICSALKRMVPQIVDWLEQIARDYRSQGGFWRRRAFDVAEWLQALDWNDIRLSLYRKLNDRQTREEIKAFVPRFTAELKRSVSEADADAAIAALQNRASDFAVDIVEQRLAELLPNIGHRLADDSRFWRWLSTEGIPALRPYVLGWLEQHGTEAIGDTVDIAGRVESAVNHMDIREVHEVITDASVRHLGAIQVLGYFLGMAVGLCLMLV